MRTITAELPLNEQQSKKEKQGLLDRDPFVEHFRTECTTKSEHSML